MFEKARTSLQGIEDRIRRLFGSVGTIGVEWAPALTPVMVAGDLFQPGLSEFRGRRWALYADSSGLTPPPTQAITFSPTLDVIIDRVILNWEVSVPNLGASLNFEISATSSAAYPDTSRAKTIWRENPEALLGPVIYQQGAQAVTFAPSFNPIVRAVATTTAFGPFDFPDLGLFVKSTQYFGVRQGSVTGDPFSFCIHGRIP